MSLAVSYRVPVVFGIKYSVQIFKFCCINSTFYISTILLLNSGESKPVSWNTFESSMTESEGIEIVGSWYVVKRCLLTH